MSFAQEIYQGDTGPSLPTAITIGGLVPPDAASGDNDPADPSGKNGAHDVGVFLRKTGETCFSRGAGTLTVVGAAADWNLLYTYDAADSDKPGPMLVQWRFTQGASPNEEGHTAPTPGYDRVNVLAREVC